MSIRTIILLDTILLLLLTASVVFNNFIFAIIPLITAWLAVTAAVISFIRPPSPPLQLPLGYHAAYGTIFVILLLLGSHFLTAIAYLIVPIAITTYFTQHSQENK